MTVDASDDWLVISTYWHFQHKLRHVVPLNYVVAWFPPTSRCPVYGSVISVYVLALHYTYICTCVCAPGLSFPVMLIAAIVRVPVERSQMRTTQLF